MGAAKAVRLTGAASLAAAAVLAVAIGCAPKEARTAREPLAVVLCQKGGGRSELVVVDLEAFEIVRRTRLRTLCLSIDGDSGSRVVATAQCGGPDSAADSACGVFDVVTGEVSYVDLPFPNPSDLAVTDGRAYVVHGFEQQHEVCVSTVGLRSRSVLSTDSVPGDPRRPERAGGSMVMPVGEAIEGPTAKSRVRVARADAAAREVECSFDSATAVASGDGAGIAYLLTGEATGSGRDSEQQWWLRTVETGGPRLLSWCPVGVERDVLSACVVGDEIAIADANLADLADPGRTIRVVGFDGRTRRTIEVAGVPSAVRAWRGRLLVVDGLADELLLFERGATVPSRRLDLGSDSRGDADLVVFDEPGGGP